MTDALVLDMPVELGPKLVAIVGSDFANAEWKLFNDIVDEVDGAGLVVALIDLEGSDAGGVINSCVLITLDRFVAFALERQELNINLDVMTRHLFLVTLGVDLAQPCAPWKPADTIALENAVNASTGYFDVMVAGEIPDNADRPEMVSLPQVQNWPARYFVPDAVRDYCMDDLSSRGIGFGAIVTGAGGL